MEMWRSKKVIAITVLATLLVIGSIGGVALATDNGDDGEPEAKYEALLDRVCEIYQEKTGVTIDQEALKDAFAQAQSEMQTEALRNRLQNLVDQGKITQGEADQYLEWWQARPDIEPFRQQLKEWQQARPGIPPELKEWQQAEPDMLPPGPFGRFGRHGFHGGMKWGRGRYFWDR